MNVVRVMGGLGNQLFQYAFGKAQMRNGIDVQFKLPTGKEVARSGTRRKEWPRPYCLDKFCLELQPSEYLKQETIHEHMIVGAGFSGIRKLEDGHDLSLLKRTDCNFEGYWQHIVYFQDFLPLLRKEFQIKKEFQTEEFLRLSKEITSCKDSVSMHVRRGDYVLQGGFHELPFKYYFEALSLTKGDIYIFSDDIPWCKEKFKEEYISRKITFVQLEVHLDFALMRLCKHHIIANSTLSYMMAILEDHLDNVIVVPSGWISGARELGDKELMEKANGMYYYDRWLKI